MIKQSTIEAVFETARVEEVIGDFVQLKRAGSNLKGLSPFVSEKSPSFMVSPVKQIWKDFSSGKGGNAVTFIMEHEHFSFPEAIRYLAKKYNIEIEETEQTNEETALANEKESMYLVSEYASKYFQDILHNKEEGKAIGLTYFKERGFSTDTIKKFGLGYSPDTWDAFTKEALGKGYKLDYLEKTGLTIVKENTETEEKKLFDRFKGRVMFPIQSMSGRVLGFGGRILTNDKKAAKYLNSPESEIYHKSKVLYGIYFAKQAIAKLNNCYLVEGYTDVIQLHQAGIENVVASSGTALTPDQINLVKRLTPNITVLFDGDAAGLRASVRGIDLILEAGMNVRVCTFPDGDDPDSFAKKTPLDELKYHLEEKSKDFIQFKASLLMEEAQNDPIKKADLIRDMVVSISKISDRIKREIYLRECSRIMDISEDVLFNTLAQLDKKELQDANKKFVQEQKEKAFEVVKSENAVHLLTSDEIAALLERKIIEILVLYGEKELDFDEIYISADESENEITVTEKRKRRIFDKINFDLQQDEIEFATPVFRELITKILNSYLQQGTFEPNDHTHNLSPEEQQILIDVLMNDEKYRLDNWEEKKQVVVRQKDNEQVLLSLITDTVASYREYLIQKLTKTMLSDFIQNQNNNPQETENNLSETTPLEEIMQTINDYNRLKFIISDSIGRVRTDYFK